MVENCFHGVTMALTIQQYLLAPVSACLHFVIIIIVRFLIFVFAIAFVFYGRRILEFLVYLFGRVRLVVRNLLGTGLALALDDGS